MPNSQTTPNRLGSWELAFGRLLLDFDHLAPKDFLLRNRNLPATRFPRQRALEQLAHPLAGQDDELEPIFLGCSFHVILRAGVMTRPCTVYDVRDL